MAIAAVIRVDDSRAMPPPKLSDPHSTLLIVAPWRSDAPPPTRTPGPNRPELEARLARVVPEFLGRLERTTDGFLLHQLDPDLLLRALGHVLRGRHWVAAICLRTPNQPRVMAARLVQRARRQTWGLAVRQDHLDPRCRDAHAALSLHATNLRGRTPTAWRAFDAVELQGNATRAAASLGCSTQAVTRIMRANHAGAPALTADLLRSILARHPVRPDSPARPHASARP